jgi:predicted glycosyltransferase involved in capsule biosynthesis
MKTLTIVASNRDRLKLKTNITKYFLKSLAWQTCQNFEVIIVDGGSHNFKALNDFFKLQSSPSIRMVQEEIGEKFERAKLNNVGIRNANTEYIMTTDVDMMFGPDFVKELLSRVGENIFVESRTMYLKGLATRKIYKGKIDPLNDIDSCKIGRIKKRSTAGGCQCAHIDQWNKVRGFDEDFIGWGSEDYDLLMRMVSSGAKEVWMGESSSSLNLFHQHHEKINIKEDLLCQDKNKKLMMKAARGKRPFQANPNGWGGEYV